MKKKTVVCTAVFALLAFSFAAAPLRAEELGTAKAVYPIPNTQKTGVVKVYFTRDISAAGIAKIYEALGRKPAANDKVAVKVSTGEAGNNHYVDPQLIGDLVKSWKGTIVECNTSYGGSRAATAMHKQVARDHGWYKIADVDIMDEKGEVILPAVGHLAKSGNVVGASFPNYTFHAVISHFKGHGMAGFGGALKNMSIGYGTGKKGKVLIHSAGTRTSGSINHSNQNDFLESMAEASKAIVDAAGADNYIYINVMNHLSIDCDCDGSPSAPNMSDIGITASLDPVALDKASLDLLYADPGRDPALIRRIENCNGYLTVVHAANLGLGSLEYELIEF